MIQRDNEQWKENKNKRKIKSLTKPGLLNQPLVLHDIFPI